MNQELETKGIGLKVYVSHTLEHIAIQFFIRTNLYSPNKAQELINKFQETFIGLPFYDNTKGRGRNKSKGQVDLSAKYNSQICYIHLGKRSKLIDECFVSFETSQVNQNRSFKYPQFFTFDVSTAQRKSDDDQYSEKIINREGIESLKLLFAFINKLENFVNYRFYVDINKKYFVIPYALFSNQQITDSSEGEIKRYVGLEFTLSEEIFDAFFEEEETNFINKMDKHFFSFQREKEIKFLKNNYSLSNENEEEKKEEIDLSIRQPVASNQLRQNHANHDMPILQNQISQISKSQDNKEENALNNNNLSLSQLELNSQDKDESPEDEALKITTEMKDLKKQVRGIDDKMQALQKVIEQKKAQLSELKEEKNSLNKQLVQKWNKLYKCSQVVVNSNKIAEENTLPMDGELNSEEESYGMLNSNY